MGFFKGESMENTGFKAVTNEGDIVIDTSYENLVLKRVIKFKDMHLLHTSAPWHDNDAVTIYKYVDLKDDEILVAREINSRPRKMDMPYAANTFNAPNLFCYSGADNPRRAVYAYNVYKNNTNEKAEAGELRLFIFGKDDKKSAKSKGQGLQLFDKTGKCIYDSNKAYMKVLEMVTYSPFSLSDPETVYPLGKKTYAVVESSMNLPNYTNNGQSAELRALVDTLYQEQGGVVFSLNKSFIPGFAINLYDFTFPISGCLLLDVTGY